MSLPTTAEERKNIPIMSGFLDYFPDATAMVAFVSKVGNDQHNPGQPLHWSRGKSGDHADAAVRHLMERGDVDSDGLLHSAKAAWRAMANLQEELERLGAPMARGARYDEEVGDPIDDFVDGDRLSQRVLPEVVPTPKTEAAYRGGATALPSSTSSYAGGGDPPHGGLRRSRR